MEEMCEHHANKHKDTMGEMDQQDLTETLRVELATINKDTKKSSKGVMTRANHTFKKSNL